MENDHTILSQLDPDYWLKSPSKGITVGARRSLLSQKQVWEVESEIRFFHPHISFSPIFVETYGDIDQKTSLRSLDKTDFFTREVDQLLLSGNCRIAVHSAKDLPHPLPEGLCVVALTAGADPSDSLVLRAGVTLKTLPQGAVIATSSERRESAVLELVPHATFTDLRGTIAQRLAKLDRGEADGVVVAEAALFRLGMTHLNRFTLPGKTVEGQGRLAVVACTHDWEMQSMFKAIDFRPMPLASL
jgi:hydroxymethylbilane synthase